MRSREFLKFNGHDLYYAIKDGVNYIAYKPVCDALGIDYSNAHRDLRNHKVFSKEIINQQVVTESGSKAKTKAMTCIPERLVYFWLATLKSDNPDLISYQIECSEVLYNFFHGAFGGRMILLEQKYKAQLEIAKLSGELKNNKVFSDLRESRKRLNKINKDLEKNDHEAQSKRLTLFN